MPIIPIYKTWKEKLTTRVHSTFANLSRKLREIIELWTLIELWNDSKVAMHSGVRKAATEKAALYRVFSCVGRHLKLIEDDSIKMT